MATDKLINLLDDLNVFKSRLWFHVTINANLFIHINALMNYPLMGCKHNWLSNPLHSWFLFNRRFTMTVTVKGVTYRAFGANKKQAKHACARSALIAMGTPIAGNQRSNHYVRLSSMFLCHMRWIKRETASLKCALLSCVSRNRFRVIGGGRSCRYPRHNTATPG